jgi:A118 family predicted phage portal protein
MFQKILEWIRRFFMINKTNVKQALRVDVAMSDLMVAALQKWVKMYENKADWIKDNVHSLNLPAAIAGEIARAVTIEMEVKIDGSARAAYLTEQFTPVLNKIRQMVEYGVAKGGLMFKPYVKGKTIMVDYVQADQFYPIAFDANGDITSCVFSDQRTVGDKYYTRLEYHAMTGKGCKIVNKAYRSTAKDSLGEEVPLNVIDAWKDLKPEATITVIGKPLFAYFKFPSANNIDSQSPLGVSCYSRAIDLIKDADQQWSDLLWEFESGKRALYVDVLAFGKDADGKPILPNKRLYRTLETGSAEGEMFEAWSPDLRETNILNGLEAILRKVEFTCGLAYGTLSNPQTVDKTATEIKISQQRSYATVADTQKSLQRALDQLLWAMDTWATLNKLAPKGTYTATYDFDDSVVVDSEAQFTQDLRMVTSVIMGKVEFRMRNLGEDEETAKKKIAEAEAEQPAVDEFGLAKPNKNIPVKEKING